IWLRSRRVGSPVSKLIGGLLCLIFVPTLMGLLPGHMRWLHTIPIQGIIGSAIAEVLTHYLNYPGACILSMTLVAASLYMTTTFSVASLRNWLTIRFAFIAAWRDRWRNWSTRRAERKAARIAARTLEKEQAALANHPEDDPRMFEDTRKDVVPTRVRKRPDFWEEPVPAPPPQKLAHGISSQAAVD